MGYLLGLQEYLGEVYNISIFDQAIDSKNPWKFHLHNQRIVSATVLENPTYDLKLDIEGVGEEEIQKIQVKFMYPAELAESVSALIKTEKEVKRRGLEAISSPKNRYFVKNKSLFPIMKERQVVFITLLEGEILRGIIAGFSRYDITVNLKGGMPVTILRHSIYDLRDKKGRCFLKSFQEKYRDWEKSDLFIENQNCS